MHQINHNPPLSMVFAYLGKDLSQVRLVMGLHVPSQHAALSDPDLLNPAPFRPSLEGLGPAVYDWNPDLLNPVLISRPREKEKPLFIPAVYTVSEFFDPVQEKELLRSWLLTKKKPVSFRETIRHGFRCFLEIIKGWFGVSCQDKMNSIIRRNIIARPSSFSLSSKGLRRLVNKERNKILVFHQKLPT